MSLITTKIYSSCESDSSNRTDSSFKKSSVTLTRHASDRYIHAVPMNITLFCRGGLPY